jgi:hypothetical protein
MGVTRTLFSVTWPHLGGHDFLSISSKFCSSLLVMDSPISNKCCNFSHTHDRFQPIGVYTNTHTTILLSRLVFAFGKGKEREREKEKERERKKENGT